MPDWIQILQIIVPAILGSAATGFYFNLRIKRSGNYDDVTRLLLDRLIQGGSQISGTMDTISRIMKEIVSDLERDVYLEQRGSHIATDRGFYYAVREFNVQLSAHRIYVTELVPYGHSGTIAEPISRFEVCLDDFDNQNISDEDAKRSINVLRKASDDFDQFRGNLRSRIDHVRRDILNGRVPRAEGKVALYGM